MSEDTAQWLKTIGIILVLGGGVLLMFMQVHGFQVACRERFMDKGLPLGAALEACK